MSSVIHVLRNYSVVLYLPQTEQMKSCQQLMINAIGLSVIDPKHLDLGLVDELWLQWFPPCSFDNASKLYKEIADSDYSQCFKNQLPCLPCTQHFSGVIYDLFTLPLAISPLDRLQLLISAFRKAMLGVSRLKLCASDRADRNAGGTSTTGTSNNNGNCV